MTEHQNQSPTVATPPGARIGTLIGFTSWAVALGVVLITSGAPRLGVMLGATGVAAGFALGQLCLMAVESRSAACEGARMGTLWGALLSSAGLLLLLWEGMAARIAEDSDLWERLGSMGGATVAPTWVSMILLAAGASLLAIAGRVR